MNFAGFIGSFRRFTVVCTSESVYPWNANTSGWDIFLDNSCSKSSSDLLVFKCRVNHLCNKEWSTRLCRCKDFSSWYQQINLTSIGPSVHCIIIAILLNNKDRICYYNAYHSDYMTMSLRYYLLLYYDHATMFFVKSFSYGAHFVKNLVR